MRGVVLGHTDSVDEDLVFNGVFYDGTDRSYDTTSPDRRRRHRFWGSGSARCRDVPFAWWALMKMRNVL